MVKHHRHGFLLLEATKARKGRHFQLPGGCVDAEEVEQYGEKEACRWHTALPAPLCTAPLNHF